MKHYLRITFGLFIVSVLFILASCEYSDSPRYRATDAMGDSALKAKLMSHYNQWKGTPYQWGGQSRRGVDCSGFTQITMNQVLNTSIPRSTKLQSSVGNRINQNNLKVGDLVFFKPKRKVRHVGIYMGNRQFMHASTSQGVTISNMDSNYWTKAYWMSRRVD